MSFTEFRDWTMRLKCLRCQSPFILLTLTTCPGAPRFLPSHATRPGSTTSQIRSLGWHLAPRALWQIPLGTAFPCLSRSYAYSVGEARTLNGHSNPWLPAPRHFLHSLWVSALFSPRVLPQHCPYSQCLKHTASRLRCIGKWGVSAGCRCCWLTPIINSF